MLDHVGCCEFLLLGFECVKESVNIFVFIEGKGWFLSVPDFSDVPDLFSRVQETFQEYRTLSPRLYVDFSQYLVNFYKYPATLPGFLDT